MLFRTGSLVHARCQLACGISRKIRLELGHRSGHNAQALGKVAATLIGGITEIAQIDRRLHLQKFRIGLRQRLQCRPCLRREGEQMG